MSLDSLAREKGTTRGAVIRLALASIAKGDEATELLKDLAAALGLEADASPDQTLDAIADLLGLKRNPTEASDALHDAPDEEPPDLTAQELKSCRRFGCSPRFYAQQLSQRAAPKPAPAPQLLTDAEKKAIRARGIDAADYLARKAALLNRGGP
jgi:hypothetical protein